MASPIESASLDFAPMRRVAADERPAWYAWLLATKLFVPIPRADLAPRPRLDATLDGISQHRLTILAAPAGWGKTTALAAWLATPAATNLAAAWVALDAGDNDPARFWAYLVAALSSFCPRSAEEAMAMIRTPQPPPIEHLLIGVLNELTAQPRDVVLILDDYHVIDTPAIHAALNFFLDHLPSRLHLVIASRIDLPLPVARWRARGSLLELRADDLRFTAGEAATFLRDTMRLVVAEEDAAALATRTEGWAAALHLAALSLRHHPDRHAFVTTFAGSHRFLVDYLGEEVLAQQPASVQCFLLETAILDRLSGPLCNAVTGGSDGQSALVGLEQGNVFIVPLDEARQWYRYHHLFAEFLRARALAVGVDPLPLHRRAANWFERAGMIAEAVSHALAADDAESAARLVEQSAETMWMGGEMATLLRWIERLPPTALDARPWLTLAHAWGHLLTKPYKVDTSDRLLAAAAAAIDGRAVVGDASGHDELPAMLTATVAAVASVREDGPLTIAKAREALALLPPVNSFWQVVTKVSLGMGYAADGQLEEADRMLIDAIAACQATGNWYSALVAIYTRARVLLAQERLRAAARLCHDGLAFAAEHRLDGLSDVGRLNVLLGRIRYEWNDLEAATRYLETAIAQARQDDEEVRILIDAYVTLARVKHACGDASGAVDALRQAERVAAAYPLPWATVTVAAWDARLALARGELTALEHGGRWADRVLPHHPLSFATRQLVRLTQARLLMARGEWAATLALLSVRDDPGEPADPRGAGLEEVLLAALAFQAGGDLGAARATLERGLALAEPEGYVRLFVDEGVEAATLLGRWLAAPLRADQRERFATLREYAERLLTAFPSRVPELAGPRMSLPGLAEPLTARERDVLGLMAAGLTNAEIAERLFISVSTVKTYVNTLFAKFAVRHRAQAVARARELGLLME